MSVYSNIAEISTPAMHRIMREKITGLMDLPPGISHHLYRFVEPQTIANGKATLEIRLLIYAHLLISHRQSHFPEMGLPSDPDSKVLIRDYSYPRTLSPSSVYFDIPPPYSPKPRRRRSLFPEILATCKAIHREASPYLCYYRETVFCFPTLHTNHRYIGSHIWSSSEDIRFGPNVFDWKSDQLWLEKKVPPIFRGSVVAAFLAKIGPENAAKITQLSLHCEYWFNVSWEIRLVTQLVRLNMPRLKAVEVEVMAKEMVWDRWHGGYLPPPQFHEWHFERMVRNLEKFVAAVPWLQNFRYKDGGAWAWKRQPWDSVKDLISLMEGKNRTSN